MCCVHRNSSLPMRKLLFITNKKVTLASYFTFNFKFIIVNIIGQPLQVFII